MNSQKDDIILDEKFKKELPEDDPNAMYDREKAVQQAAPQTLNKHQMRKLRRENLNQAPKSRASEKKLKKKEAQRKLREKYERRDEIIQKAPKVEIPKEASIFIKPTSSLGTKMSKRQKYDFALKRKEMGLSYDESLIKSVEDKKISFKSTEETETKDITDDDSSSDDEELQFKTCEEPLEPPKYFTPLIKVVQEKQQTKNEQKEDEPEIQANPEPRPAINVQLNRPEGIDEVRSKLPIIGEEYNIVETIHENDVVVVCGETGSGKTTQIPQFLYEAGYGTSRTQGKIAVTEPRRVAAINMSKRVAYEMGFQWGREVGYQIRNDKLYTESTVIKFCTDGILLREAEDDLLLSKYSVIIIDEAHERTINTDVLIGLLSRVVRRRRQKVEMGEIGVERLKLIIMSATLRTDDFLKNERLFEVQPPLINIDTRQFEVKLHYSKETPLLEDRMKAVKHCVEMIHELNPPGGILVFLPGKKEINECVKYFKDNYPSSLIKGKKSSENEDVKHKKDINENTSIKNDDDDNIMDDEIMNYKENINIKDKKPMNVFPLYSQLPQIEQDKVFRDQPKDARFVVFSTNIAETSVTIPNIRYVVDLGLEKCRQFDFSHGVITTNVDFISKASAEQRQGRAGRTGPGHCYRLYSIAFFSKFKKYTDPEIQRKPITEVVLLLKTMGLNDISKFPFPSLITYDGLKNAENTLLNIGLIEKEPPFAVTTLGKLVSQFPLEPRLGKLIVRTIKLNLIDYAIVLAAALEVREPLSSDHKLPDVLISDRGDPFTLLNVFGAYLYADNKRQFCSDYKISQKAMEEIKLVRQQLTSIIWKADKKCLKSKEPGMLEKPQDDNIYKNLAFCLFDSYCDNVGKYIKGNTYEIASSSEKNFEIRGNSCLFDKKCPFITYVSIEESNDHNRFNYVTKISESWINQIGSKNYLTSKITGIPIYYPIEDVVMTEVESTFGKHNWRLRPAKIPDPEPYKCFAAALLDGTVLPQFKIFKNDLNSDPNHLLMKNKVLPQRLLMVVFELKKEKIASRKALEERWDKEPLFLLPQVIMWYSNKSTQTKITQIWPFRSTNKNLKIEDSYSDSDSE